MLRQGHHGNPCSFCLFHQAKRVDYVPQPATYFAKSCQASSQYRCDGDRESRPHHAPHPKPYVRIYDWWRGQPTAQARFYQHPEDLLNIVWAHRSEERRVGNEKRLANWIVVSKEHIMVQTR